MYKYKDLYTIDFTNVKYYTEMHEIIRDSLEFPDYYGCNWDALWDCLTDMLGEPIHIEIIGLEIIEQKFDDAADMLIDTLKDLKHYRNDKFTHEIQIEIVTGDLRTSIS